MTGTVTAGDLSAVDVFVVMLPDDAFTAAEATAIGDFAANGGTLLLMGEQGGFAPTENGYLDGLLAGLGSAMSLDGNSLDTSGLQNTGAGQIVSQPGLTDDVLVVNYGNVSSISGVSSANELFLTSNLLSLWGGFESIGNGRIILLGDTNMVSNLEDTVGNDNHVFFSNLVGIDTQNTSVKVLTSALAGMIANADADNDLNAFYLDAGITSSLWAGEVSDESLAGAELFVVMVPDDAFTVSELTAMDDFLFAGGRILFMGEQQGFAPVENAYINSALSSVGSAMTLDLASLDAMGLQDTVAGQIQTHPYNTGVGLVNYGNTNSISGVPVGGGLDGELFRATDLTSVWGAVEVLAGGGTVILLADLNMLSNIEDELDNDNHVFFLNIAPLPTSPVELPLMGPLGVLALAGLLAWVGAGAARRR